MRDQVRGHFDKIMAHDVLLQRVPKMKRDEGHGIGTGLDWFINIDGASSVERKWRGNGGKAVAMLVSVHLGCQDPFQTNESLGLAPKTMRRREEKNNHTARQSRDIRYIRISRRLSIDLSV